MEGLLPLGLYVESKEKSYSIKKRVLEVKFLSLDHRL